MAKVPEYTRRAIEKYGKGKQRVTLLLPEGLKSKCEEKFGKGNFTKKVIELLERELEQK